MKRTMSESNFRNSVILLKTIIKIGDSEGDKRCTWGASLCCGETVWGDGRVTRWLLHVSFDA